MKVKTIKSEQVWQSPDGQKTIWNVTLEADGKEYPLKTFDEKVAAVGFEGEVESFANQRGERFVRLPGGDISTDSRIRAQWAITNAVTAATMTPEHPDYYTEITDIAEHFYDMAIKLQGRA